MRNTLVASTMAILLFSGCHESGGNNGLGVRAEQGKDAAYYGMELQTLDDSATEYAELQPYQYHGSIYGVAPAERGHQRPRTVQPLGLYWLSGPWTPRGVPQPAHQDPLVTPALSPNS